MKIKNQSPLWIILIAIGLPALVVSCQPTPAPTQYVDNGEIQDVRVQTAEPIKNTSKVEQFPLPNCGGSDKLGQSLGTFASVSKSATVGGKATVTGGGEVAIPATAKLKLEIQVELAYQQTFEAANSRLDTIEMSAAAGTHVVYTIVWEEQTFNSIVQYSSDGKVYEVPYTYVLSVPKIDRSYSVACDESSENGNGAATQTPPVSVTTRVPPVIIVVQPTSAPATAIPPTEVLPPPTPTVQITAFTVFANQPWQDTGVAVNQGQRIQIVFKDGTWAGRVGWEPSLPDIWTDAGGIDYQIYYPEFGITSRFASLIGKIGNGPVLQVGHSYDSLSAQTGVIFLRMFDTDLSDNDGSINVEVMVWR